MAELVSYHVQSIVKEKVQPTIVNRYVTYIYGICSNCQGLLQDEQTALPSPVATPTAHHAYFALEARNGQEMEPAKPTPQPVERESAYFILEKGQFTVSITNLVYD